MTVTPFYFIQKKQSITSQHTSLIISNTRYWNQMTFQTQYKADVSFSTHLEFTQRKFCFTVLFRNKLYPSHDFWLGTTYSKTKTLNVMWILACTIFGLWRKISAGKSCIITSWRSSHVLQIKLWLLLLKELKMQFRFKYD